MLIATADAEGREQIDAALSERDTGPAPMTEETAENTIVLTGG